MIDRQEVEDGEQEDTVNNGEEKTTGRESRTESERQERWRDEGDGSLADDEDEDDDAHRMSFAFTPLVKIVNKTDEKQTECYDVRPDDVGAVNFKADDVGPDDVNTHWGTAKQSRENLDCLSNFIHLIYNVMCDESYECVGNERSAVR